MFLPPTRCVEYLRKQSNVKRWKYLTKNLQTFDCLDLDHLCYSTWVARARPPQCTFSRKICCWFQKVQKDSSENTKEKKTDLTTVCLYSNPNTSNSQVSVGRGLILTNWIRQSRIKQRYFVYSALRTGSQFRMSSTVASTWFVMAGRQSRPHDGEHIDQRHTSVSAEER